jgi:hypothetical protein
MLEGIVPAVAPGYTATPLSPLAAVAELELVSDDEDAELSVDALSSDAALVALESAEFADEVELEHAVSEMPRINAKAAAANEIFIRPPQSSVSPRLIHNAAAVPSRA